MIAPVRSGERGEGGGEKMEQKRMRRRNERERERERERQTDRHKQTDGLKWQKKRELERIHVHLLRFTCLNGLKTT